MVATETNGAPEHASTVISPIPIHKPNNLPTGAVFEANQPEKLIPSTPTPTPSQPLPPPTHLPTDRRASIDTSIMQPGGMRVLLVEDNEINMKLLVAYMRKLKLNHSTAINGLEALNAYKEAKGGFDVIFMGSSPLFPLASPLSSHH
jgi:hypothetical protein